MFEFLKKKAKKRGQLGGLGGSAIAIGVVAIVLAFVGLILTQTQTQVLTQATNTSAAYNATVQGLTAVNTFASWLGIIVVVLLGGLVITFLVTRFGGMGGGQQ